MQSRRTLTTKPRRATSLSPSSVQSQRESRSATDAPRDYAHARHELIAVRAYYLAEARGFTPGAEIDDWLAAEAQVDARGREGQATGDAGERPG
jgi:hypothetical protein